MKKPRAALATISHLVDAPVTNLALDCGECLILFVLSFVLFDGDTVQGTGGDLISCPARTSSEMIVKFCFLIHIGSSLSSSSPSLRLFPNNPNCAAHFRNSESISKRSSRSPYFTNLLRRHVTSALHSLYGDLETT